MLNTVYSYYQKNLCRELASDVILLYVQLQALPHLIQQLRVIHCKVHLPQWRLSLASLILITEILLNTALTGSLIRELVQIILS